MESDLDEANIALANLFRMTGRFDQAREKLEPLISQAQPNPEALVAMGQVESSLNNPTAAEALFDRANEAPTQSRGRLHGAGGIVV